uniref:Transmembrane beta-barrels n=1 Tax=synthetic construct TaxID=32630 RepID=UPI00194ADAD6|nr:Chain A, Transmembrane beta-barrels [synthetic construct]
MEQKPGTLMVYVVVGYNTDNTVDVVGGAQYAVSPYLFLDVGYGWNNSSLNFLEVGGGVSYKVSPDLEPYVKAGFEYNTDNTIKPTAGAGALYRVSPNLALMVEYGWNNSSLQKVAIGIAYKVKD